MFFFSVSSLFFLVLLFPFTKRSLVSFYKKSKLNETNQIESREKRERDILHFSTGVSFFFLFANFVKRRGVKGSFFVGGSLEDKREQGTQDFGPRPSARIDDEDDKGVKMRGKGEKKESAVKRLVVCFFDVRGLISLSRSLSFSLSFQSLSSLSSKTRNAKVAGVGTTVVEAAPPPSSTPLHRERGRKERGNTPNNS